MESMKVINLFVLLLLLVTTCINAYAGKIYRFVDKDGTSTMSKSLPPYAAQGGYDILDDTSLRLIERVYTQEELIKVQQQKKHIEAIKQKKQQKIDDERALRIAQRTKDRTLLARYPTEQVFIKSRDANLRYRQNQVDELNSALEEYQRRLVELQTVAAETEINGETLSPSLQKHLEENEAGIKESKRLIAETIGSNKLAEKQYKSDLTRLRQLLTPKSN
jgi:hypothetical protein